MNEHAAKSDGRNRQGWRIAGWGLAAALLLAPAAAMQVTDEVAWGPADFAVAAGLIAGVGIALELAIRTTRNGAYRAAAGIALAAAFLLVWINLAVGIIGSENDPANWMYAGVIAIAMAGSALARFRAGGMAAAMVAAALAQMAVGAVALGLDLGPAAGPATALFGALWLLAAALFRKAAREPQ